MGIAGKDEKTANKQEAMKDEIRERMRNRRSKNRTPMKKEERKNKKPRV
jgi:hypothetical protein